jgi:hypothetical protein
MSSTLTINEFSTNTIQIYPNPSSGQLNIEASSSLKNATLTDAQGRMLHQFDLQAGLNQFNFLDLLPGSYFIQTGTSVLKWVVE